MADVNIAGAVEAVGVAENVSVPAFLLEVSKVEAITTADTLSEPSFAMKLYRGMSSITLSLITMDWSLVETLRKFASSGVKLKGMIFVPGSGAPDTFSVKDGADDGAYIYLGAVSATTVVVYPDSFCRPYVDYSECTLTAGHSITFVW